MFIYGSKHATKLFYKGGIVNGKSVCNRRQIGNTV